MGGERDGEGGGGGVIIILQAADMRPLTLNLYKSGTEHASFLLAQAREGEGGEGSNVDTST